MRELATFAAGCFWGVEETFRTTPGVIDTKVGYMGGTVKDPTYQDVCTDETGHAEVVQVTFDPEKISYEQLLEIFWNCHNPTTKNVQGPDVGSQYRSAIFTHSSEQETKAMNSISALNRAKKFARPIVTEVMPAATFYPAEDYHQQYLIKRGIGSCHR
jgi:peptide-methionine (S)-S-oxide reductase